MNILLPNEIERDLVASLKKAKNREIGGILMGEYVSTATYRIRDVTTQRHGGKFASFVRSLKDIVIPLQQFFHETNYHFTKFNYLGEWHSHPSFSLKPSTHDIESMWEIIEDPLVGANFVVLMIVHLDCNGHLQGTVTAFLPERQMLQGNLIKEVAL
jgi:proteasome lid subunit RPN8/RPN11